MDFDRPSSCTACGSRDGAEHLVVQVFEETHPAALGGPRVEIATSCRRCHHRARLPHVFPLDLAAGFSAQLDLLEWALGEATGLPVVLVPPDDPHAGVREPRHPAPGAGSVAVAVEQEAS